VATMQKYTENNRTRIGLICSAQNAL